MGAGQVTIVDLAEYCRQCGRAWTAHPELDAEGRDENGTKLGDPRERYCRQPTDAPAPDYIRRLRPRIRRGLLVSCVLLALALAVSLAAPSASAATTGTWTIRTFSGHNETRSFTYPGTVNVTVQPVNLSVSGQRSVSVYEATNASLVYFTTSIGFYPAGKNFTGGKVNVSWSVPQSLQGGAILTLAVLLSGTKVPESSVFLTVQANISHVVDGILRPILSSLQGQLSYLNQKIDGLNAQLADSQFRAQQIEAIEGLAIAGLAGYIVYERRKRTGKKEEFARSGTELEGVMLNIAMENIEPGEKIADPGKT